MALASSVIENHGSTMGSAILAGACYSASVFALGVAFGTGRVLVLVPRVGEFAAVALETPFMLTAAWALSGFWWRHFVRAGRSAERLTMGAVAFALLIVAELGLELLLGGSFATSLAKYGRPAGLLGLLAQIAFGTFPMLRGQALARRRSRRCSA